MKKWLCIIISVVMLLAAAAMPACRDEGAYKAKTEREQLLLDYFDAANRKDYTEWVNYYLAGSLRDRAQQETEKGYLDIETTTVNDIKLVDSKYCEVWISSQLSVYETQASLTKLRITLPIPTSWSAISSAWMSRFTKASNRTT